MMRRPGGLTSDRESGWHHHLLIVLSGRFYVHIPPIGAPGHNTRRGAPWSCSEKSDAVLLARHAVYPAGGLRKP